jgi:ectoine hydroxylase-related dioxygenase (phytanoyl-CoA dioxygenase family)
VPKNVVTSPSLVSVREQLFGDGFAVVPDVLDPWMVNALTEFSDALLAIEQQDHFERFRFHGSMLPLDWRHPLTEQTVANGNILDALASCGFDHPHWLSGYVISKPPRSPALWWHQDWWAWDEPESFGPIPPQLFVMLYLRDVAPEDGCLRVIPGSHRQRHRLHADLPEAHGAEIDELSRTGGAQAAQSDEVSVPVRAGDAVFGDVRLLHSTHANESDLRRTCLTLWYLPQFDALSERLRAYVVQHPSLPEAGWWRGKDHEVPPGLSPLLPRYDGSAAPARYNRVPPDRFER